MSKRPPIDLSALTAETALPMAEAVQRSAPPAPSAQTKPAVARKAPAAELEPMNFKVPAEFRRRFRQRALSADLKLNELLYAAFEAWEKQTVVSK